METQVPINVTTHPQLCIERVPNRPCALVIFGASGDLTRRKLLPALFNLFREKLLPKKFFILGTGRTKWDDVKFRDSIITTLSEDSKRDASLIKQFTELCYYSPCDYLKFESFAGLKNTLETLDKKHGSCGSVIYYLSLPPDVYGSTIENLMASKLLRPDDSDLPCTQIVVEKPFGTDLASARSLITKTMAGLSEKQIYRIDHYLGKETVQNILMLRFANSIFEPLWTSQYIDHVQITATEALGVEHRAGYYDSAGVLRDMFQNHMLELLSLVAMEPPVNFDPVNYRDEKVRVLKFIRPIPMAKMEEHFVRGQYAAGEIKGEKVPAYLDEPGVKPGSQTETFSALKIFVDNPRWQDVPFYLRSGKRLKGQKTEIIIQFKHIPHSIFANVPANQIPQNQLRIHIQPDEGIQLNFNSKYPGPKMCMATLGLEFNYKSVFDEKDLSAYERLILDCMHADPTLFVRQDMVEVAWGLIETLLKPMQNGTAPKLHLYPSGSWGPQEAAKLIRTDGRDWA